MDRPTTPASAPAPAPSRSSTSPTIGLCLGAGGARGLAHVVVLEALDELGLRPAAISGASMGAVIGACAAAGLSARALRAHISSMTRDPAGALARAFAARADRGAGGWTSLLGRPILIEGERFLDQFWPREVPADFEALQIPLRVVATDFFARAPAAFESGPLAPAVAGSMAMPGLVRPVRHQGRALVDGALVDPLPYQALFERCDVVIASDVVGGPIEEGRAAPDRFEALFFSSQIMQSALVAERLSRRAPHALLRPPVEGWKALDFFAAPRILRAAEADREGMKRAIDAALTAATRKTP